MMDETVTVPGAGVFRWCTPCCCARMELFDSSLWRRAVDLAALEREVGKYAGRTRETVPRYLDQVKKLADAKREAAETCFSIVSTLCPHK